MRIWVRPATKIIMPCSDFQGPTRAFRTPQEGWCFTEASPLSPDNPIPGDECAPNKEERTLPRTLADVSEVGFVTAPGTDRYKPGMHQSPWTGSGILTRFPFATGGCLATVLDSNPDNVRHPVSAPIYRITQDRLTHGQLLFPWNPSPLRPSRFSLEYSLLPPRSAPVAAPLKLTLEAFCSPRRPSYSSPPFHA